MKKIIVYIVALIMMMPSVSLLAEVDIKTSGLFDTKAIPFNNNPFAGGNPKNIERNLFTRKPIKIQNINRRSTDFEHNKYQNNKAILNINTTTRTSQNVGGAISGTEYRNYNKASQIAQATNATYSMPTNSGITMTAQTEAFSDETVTVPSENNNYEGSGAPPEIAPLGDVLLPLLFFIGIYLITLRNRKSSVKI